MARTLTWRTAVATLALAAGLTACGGGNQPGGNGNASPSGDAQIGGAPPASASATPPPGATPTKGVNTSVLYPKSARTYSQEVLRAWAGRNYARLGQLGNTAAVQQVRDSVSTGGVPNTQWGYIRCGPAETAGFTVCVFRNAHGDETAIELETAKLGGPNAVTKVPLDRTSYPSDPVAYAGELLGAHDGGNAQRVLRLSNAGVKAKVTCRIERRTARLELVDGTYSRVIVTGEGIDIGKSYVFTILAQPGGKPHAVQNAMAVC